MGDLGLLIGLILLSEGAFAQTKIYTEPDQPLQIVRIRVRSTNCYLVWDTPSRQAMVIDPGFDAEKILGFIKVHKLIPKAIVQTHGHYDHCSASIALHKRTKAPIYLHQAQEKLIGKSLGRPKSNTVALTKYLKHRSQLKLGQQVFEVMHTPGHSPGSISIYSNLGFLFTGDLLFRGAVGRSDLRYADARELIRSVTVRLQSIPDRTMVLPGHGEATQLGFERKTNPFLRPANIPQ